MRTRTELLVFCLPALLASGCAASAASSRLGAAAVPDVVLANAQAVAASHRFVAEPLVVPLPPRIHDGVQARLIFARAAAARGAHLMSDLEFHFAVEDSGAYECVVRLQTLPASRRLTPLAPPDAVTQRLTRPVRYSPDGEAPSMNCDAQVYYTQGPLNGKVVAGYDPSGCQAGKAHRSTTLPFWAAQLGFVPLFYDRGSPPRTGGRWILFVSEPQCVARPAPLAASFVRGSIYREAPALPPAPEAPAVLLTPPPSTSAGSDGDADAPDEASPAPAPTAPR